MADGILGQRMIGPELPDLGFFGRAQTAIQPAKVLCEVVVDSPDGAVQMPAEEGFWSESPRRCRR